METTKIEFIKLNRRFPRTFDDYFRYNILIFPLLFIIIGSFLGYNVYKFNREDLSSISFVLLIGGIVLFIVTWVHLKGNIKFTEISTGLSLEENLIKSEKILKDKFRVKNFTKKNKKGLVCGTTNLTAFSWGEEITIVCMDEKILVNSKSLQPVALFKNHLNVRKIKKGFK